MLRHNAGVHKLLPQDPNGRPFIQNNPSIPTGFNDLAFIDFSCKKFAHIAQVRARPADQTAAVLGSDLTHSPLSPGLV